MVFAGIANCSFEYWRLNWLCQCQWGKVALSCLSTQQESAL